MSAHDQVGLPSSNLAAATALKDEESPGGRAGAGETMQERPFKVRAVQQQPGLREDMMSSPSLEVCQQSLGAYLAGCFRIFEPRDSVVWDHPVQAVALQA